MLTKMARRIDEVMDFGFEIKEGHVSSTGEFEGYGSTFGGAPDSGGDVVMRGAFTKTIKAKGRNGNGIAMLWSHDPKRPIGVWDLLQEDDKGLYCKGRVHPDAKPDGVPVLDLMRMGSIRGLSIGYNTVQADRDEKKGIRNLKELDLWEISPVTFPMNTRASITSVKCVLEAKTPRELEGALREAGMDHEVSRYLVKLCRAGLREAGSLENTAGMIAVAEELKRINAQLAANLSSATFG